MLENLRQILEEDNRIENINELMVEATDSAMMDMFIDEDGEAEIPESELNKILSKIPEYNQEEELNKKLKRLTESYIPNYDEIVEEGKKLDQKLRDTTRKINDATATSKKALVAAGGAVGAFAAITGGLGIPSIAIVSAVGATTALATANISTKKFKKKVYKYTKGEPITKSTVTKLLNACSTIKDISKFEVWLDDVDKGFTILFKDDNPKVAEQAKKFRQWLDDEIYNKKLPEKREEIKSNLKKKIKNKISKESFDFDDELYSREELIDMMEEEASLYEDGEIIEENIDDLDFNNNIVEEGLIAKIKMKKYKNLAKKNNGKCSFYQKVVQESIKKMTSERQLKNFEKSMQSVLSDVQQSIEAVKDDPEYTSYIKEANAYVKWIKTGLPKEFARRRKELGIDTVKKESMSLYETAQSIVDDLF